MSDKSLIILVALLSFFPFQMAYSDAKVAPAKAVEVAEVYVADVNDATNGWSAEAVVSKAGAGSVAFSAKDAVKGKSLPTSASARPVNLWLLVDASASCKLQQVEGLLSTMTSQIKRALPSESLVSVVSYTNAGYIVHQSQKAVGDLEASSITCGGQTISTSYEKTMSYLLDARKDKSLPVVVWVLTSGNVQLSEAGMKMVKDNDLNIHLVLYNAIIAQDLKPSIEQMNLRLGKSRVRLSTLSSESNKLPEQWYQVSIDGPSEEIGKVVAVELTASASGQKAKANFTAKVPSGAKANPLAKYGTLLMILSLIAIAIFIVYRIVKYYTPKHCGDCGKTMRFSDAHCFFCRKKTDGFLVGQFNQVNRRKVGKEDVLFLDREIVEIGTHRKSRVPLMKARGERRRSYLRILREHGTTGSVAYRVEPTADSKSIRVNGNAIQGSRYLAHGDKIAHGDVIFTFLVGV